MAQRLFREEVLFRLAMPGRSKPCHATTWDPDPDVAKVAVEKLYRMMTQLDRARQRRLQDRVASACQDLLNDVNVLFFDCTTLCFGGQKADRLRRKGWSKDSKPQRGRVVLAVTMAQGGVPVGYRLYPGSAAEVWYNPSHPRLMMGALVNRPPRLGHGCLSNEPNGHAHGHPAFRLSGAALLLMFLPVLPACGNMPLSYEWQVAWKSGPDPELVRAIEDNRSDDAVRIVKRGATLYHRRRGFGGIDQCSWGVLGLAAKKNHSEMVQRLLEVGVDPNPPVAREGPCRSALTEAAAAGHAEVVRQLLDAGAHPNWEGTAEIAGTYEKTKELIAKNLTRDQSSLRPWKRYSGSHPLVAAIRNDHTEIVRILLNAGAHLTDALTLAAKIGNIEIARLLLDAGANPNRGDPLATAFEAGHPDMVRLLLDAGARINELKVDEMLLKAGANVHGSAPLVEAAQRNHTEMARLLVALGVRLELTGKNGETALIIATRKNNVDLLRLLIKTGASVHATTKYGTSALMRAAIEGSTEAVSVLIEAGAEIDAENALGGTALVLAVKHDHPDIVRQLLNAGADPNRVSEQTGVTPLQYAASRASPSHVKLLIEAGTDVNLSSGDGLTALMFAAGGITPGNSIFVDFLWEESADFRRLPSRDDKTRWKRETDPVRVLARIEVVRQLIAVGANVNAADQTRGSTALHGAASTGRLEIVRLLLEAGADPTVVNKHGMTALHVAQKMGHPDVVEIISAATNKP